MGRYIDTLHHIYIYVYVYRERKRGRNLSVVMEDFDAKGRESVATMLAAMGGGDVRRG